MEFYGLDFTVTVLIWGCNYCCPEDIFSRSCKKHRTRHHQKTKRNKKKKLVGTILCASNLIVQLTHTESLSLPTFWKFVYLEFSDQSLISNLCLSERMNDEPSPGSIALDCPAGSHFPTAVMSFLHTLASSLLCLLQGSFLIHFSLPSSNFPSHLCAVCPSSPLSRRRGPHT